MKTRFAILLIMYAQQETKNAKILLKVNQHVYILHLKIQIKGAYILELNVKNNIKHVSFIIKMLLQKMQLDARI